MLSALFKRGVRCFEALRHLLAEGRFLTDRDSPHKNRAMAQSSSLRGLELEVEVAVYAPQATYGVVEDAVVRGGEILLDVAGVVVICDVDHF